MSEGHIVPGSIYIYAPNKIAPVFFSVAFALACGAHVCQAHSYKSWKLTALYPFSCLLFSLGFVLREYGAFNYYDTTANLNIYIASTCLIYMAPPLLELANFHVLGRILYFVPYCAPMHPGRVLTTFAMLSSLIEVLNAIGVTYLANKSLPENLINLGQVLMKVGLCLQILAIALFVLCAVVFHRRCARAGLTTNRKVSTPLIIMYISTALILARTVYRIVEYFSIANLEATPTVTAISPILRYEWFFYVFEASIMCANVCMWSIYHPRRYLPADPHVFLERDGITETEGPGWEDDANYWMTLIDPFGCTRKHKGQGDSLQEK
ncbi:hypothetical protein M406DRAFT_334491 [Cryphonectria parasitica EP155]|uniref:RTA1 domain protein n=1 Tax=Cryphonectria parasitica (strain ATCC 38755 / EP155) TaxID=660469 RepID=A0A9P4XT85_CRYP1|nr:uncharacterized protein M406DRAFT_334491 [Cryphonectria parasitica EP155]KAF3760869.1 hypothetical protein M406DRAFT_334491 [Cryphonectria parasitica EP155]